MADNTRLAEIAEWKQVEKAQFDAEWEDARLDPLIADMKPLLRRLCKAVAFAAWLERAERAAAQLIAAQARSREDAELIENMVVDAFDLGFSWARGLQGQNLEDSRAVGRTLQSYLFSEAGLTVDTDEWDSFTTADIAICEGKRRIKAALVTKLRARADELEGRTDG